MRSRSAARTTAAFSAVLLIAAGVGLTATPAYAATATVVETVVDGGSAVDCDNGILSSPVTLRSALCYANVAGGEHLISVPSGTYALDPGLGALMVGTQSGADITIAAAPDASPLIVGTGSHGVMVLDPDLVGGVSVRIDGLTIEGGVDNVFGGGAIIGGSDHSPADTLVIENSTLRNNSANTDGTNATNRPGGAIQFIGGHLTVTNSTFVNNSSGTSAGGAIAYQATRASDSLTISGSTFSGGASATTNSVPNGGAAIVIDDTTLGGATMSIADSRFDGNVVSASAAHNPRGGAVWLRGGHLDLERSTFTANGLQGSDTGAGSAIRVESDASLTAHHNRIVGNLGGQAVHAAAPVDVSNNWWGCAGGPAAAQCDATNVPAGSYSPWLTLTASADPSDIPLDEQMTTVTASLLVNSAGGAVAASDLTAFDGLPIVWSSPLPTGSELLGTDDELIGGLAVAEYAKNAASGLGSVTATVDGAVVVAPLVIAAPLAVTANPIDVTVNAGTPASFTASASGYPLPSVQWQVSTNGGVSYANLPGEIDATLTVAATLSDDGARYRAVFANADDSVVTVAAVLTVVETPFVIEQPAGQSVIAGTQATFTAAASGHPAPTVQWQVSTDGGVSYADLAGATGTSLTVDTVQSMDGNRYQAVFTNSVDTVPSLPAILRVGTTPAFTSAATATFLAGAGAQQFSVTVSGVPAAELVLDAAVPAWLTFTDLGNGTALIEGTPPSGSGGSIALRFVADNGFGTPAAQTFALEVIESAAVTSADTATFRVGAAGSFAVTAAHGTPAVTTLALAGALPAGVTFTAQPDAGTATIAGIPEAGTAGTYTVVITAGNGVAPDATQTFSLTVEQVPVVTQHPVDQVVADGAAVVFAADAEGYPAVTVQWQVSVDGGSTFADLPGATDPVLEFTANASNDEHRYRAVFTNAAASATTDAATLRIGTAPTFSSAPTATVEVGAGVASIAVSATGIPDAVLTTSGTLPAWLTFTDNGDGTALLSGEPPVGSGGIHSFGLVAGNGFTPDAAQTFALTVHEETALATTGSAIFATGVAGTATIAVTHGYPIPALAVTGTLPGGVAFVDNGDGTATVSGIPAAGSGGIHPVTVTGDNGIGDPATQAFTLTVNQPAAVTTPPADRTVVAGTPVAFEALASGFPAPTAQWQVSTDDGATYTDIAGATSLVLAFTALQADDGTLYRVVVAGTGSATSAPARLTVGTPAQITSSDRVVFTVAGGAQSVTLTASGIPVASIGLGAAPAWIGLADNGDGTATLTGTPPAGSGGEYPISITADNGFGPVAAQTITLEVVEPATITSPDAATFTIGVADSVTITTAGGYPVVPVISVDGILPDGVAVVDNGDGTATISGVPSSLGEYELTVTADNGAVPQATQTFTLTVVGPPAVTSEASATFVYGVVGEFTVTTGGGFPETRAIDVIGALPAGLGFVDNGDGTGTISGTATAPYGTTVALAVTASNASGAGETQTLTIAIVPAPVIALPPMVPLASGILQVSPASPIAGQPVTVSGSGFAPLAPVVVGVYSTPRMLGTVTADARGAFSVTFTMPADLTGAHHLVAAGMGPEGPRFLVAAVAVRAIGVDVGADVGVGVAGLPVTGAEVGAQGLAGGMLLLGGILLLVLVRLRRMAGKAILILNHSKQR